MRIILEFCAAVVLVVFFLHAIPSDASYQNLKKQIVKAELDYQELRRRTDDIKVKQDKIIDKIINKMYKLHIENEQIKKILELSGANQRGLQIQIDKLIEILTVQEYQIDILTEGTVR